MKIKQKKVSKKIIIISTVAVIIIGSTAYAVYAQSNKDKTKPHKPITYSGPSEQDKKDAQDNKANVAKRQQIEQQAQQQTSSKKQVTPVITNANQNGQQVTITAYIAGVFEDGGTCTMVASKGSTTVTRTTKGFADATTTSCSPFFIDRSVFPESGVWDIKITYSSSNAEGISQSTALTIQ